jgi:glycosyltransferase involved in cell wall biosynthesis
MRILMLSHGYPPVVSGVTLVVQKIGRAMVQKGHEVTVIAASERPEPYCHEDEGVQLIRVRSAPNPFWAEGPIPFIAQRALQEIVDRVQPEICHAHDAAFLCLQLLRHSRDSDLPLVATCYYVPRFVTRYLTWSDEPQEVVESMVWTYSVWLFNRFDHVVFATWAHRELFLEEGLHVPTTIISNGVDIVRYRPLDGQAEDVEERYDLPVGPRILFVGRLARDKEIDILIQAMPWICIEREAHLILVGRGDDQARLEELTQELDVQGCVHFLGFVPEEDMPALYRAVDLFAIASLCEVQSLPTLQAVATGLPVVAADALALPELVHDGVNGFLVPPRDPKAMAEAVLDILGDAELSRRMGLASLSIARDHAETHTFDLYEDLYQQTLTCKAGALNSPPGRESERQVAA